MGGITSIDDQMFELRMTQKQFDTFAVRCKRQEQIYETKCKTAYKHGDLDAATDYAHSAIQQRQQAQTYRQLSRKIRNLYDRLVQAERTMDVSDQLVRVVSCLQMSESSAEKMLTSLNALNLHFDRTEVVQELIVDTTHCCEPLEVSDLLQRVKGQVEDEERLAMNNLPVAHPVHRPTTSSAVAQQLSQTNGSRN